MKRLNELIKIGVEMLEVSHTSAECHSIYRLDA
jgi:hypothetical protein